MKRQFEKTNPYCCLRADSGNRFFVGGKGRRVLYIGGFEMPDGNAAAQRVLSIAKALRSEYEIAFYGITHTKDYHGIFCGFEYHNTAYPTSAKDWFIHLSGEKELAMIKATKPDIVVAYNFPALGLCRIINYCKRNNIKVVGDITEWYHPHNIVKWLDVTWRMVLLNKKMDGLIVISHFLKDYYKNQNIILIPPTIDISEEKWHHGDTPVNRTDGLITLMYAGSPGRGDKDRLDNLIQDVGRFNNLRLIIVGIGRESFEQKFPDVSVPENVMFKGRLPHKDTISLLCRSDFSVFFRKPSRVNNAGFPTKFVEAQSAGIPVIANKFSDLERYVIEGRNGFLAEDISMECMDSVLVRVATLTRGQITAMHNYTKSLNQFDYQIYNESLGEFFLNI